MVSILCCVKEDLDWHSLHYFHIVSGGILRGQQAETGAGGAGQRVNVAVIVAIVRINVNGDGLPWMHLFQLCFLEVRSDPDVVCLNDDEQLLPRLDSLTHFDRLASYDAAYRRDDFRVAQVQFRGGKLSAGTISICGGR